MSVIGGVKNSCSAEISPYTVLLPKGQNKNIQTEFLMDEKISAPIRKGDRLGTVRFLNNSDVIHEAEIIASEEVEKISFWGLLGRMIGISCLK